MEQKTKVHAEDGKQDLIITREFELPVSLLFKAFTEAEFVTQWMGTRVLKLESKKHGSYRFETTNAQGIVVLNAHGAIHELIPDQKIIRTFEMQNAAFGVQLEIYDFIPITESTSKLHMHIIYESAVLRDQVLKLPFAQGINWAHNRLQENMKKLK